MSDVWSFWNICCWTPLNQNVHHHSRYLEFSLLMTSKFSQLDWWYSNLPLAFAFQSASQTVSRKQLSSEPLISRECVKTFWHQENLLFREKVYARASSYFFGGWWFPSLLAAFHLVHNIGIANYVCDQKGASSAKKLAGWWTNKSNYDWASDKWKSFQQQINDRAGWS